MMNVVKTALVSVIKDSVGIDLSEDCATTDACLISKITLDTNVFYVAVNNDLLVEFSNCLLCDSNPDFNVLIDITNEIANLIVGKAKVLYEEKGLSMSLGIPQFIEDNNITYNSSVGYSFENMRCSVFQL